MHDLLQRFRNGNKNNETTLCTPTAQGMCNSTLVIFQAVSSLHEKFKMNFYSKLFDQ